MKTAILKALIFILITATCNAASSPFSWIAGKFSNKIYTNYDVTQHMERTLLNDNQRSSLFIEANKNYSAYKALIKERTSPMFESALKQLVYGRMLEQHATAGKAPSEWVAFRITPSEFYEETQKLETRVLGPLLDKMLGIVKSRDQFGKYLRTSNFPHKSEDTNTDIYFRWFNDQKYRLKHELKNSETKKFERISAMGPRSELLINSNEKSDFYKSAKKKIMTELNSLKMNKAQVSKYLSTKPELKLLIKDIKYLGLSTAPLSRFLDESEAKFELAKANAIKLFSPNLSSSKIQRIVRYEKLASKLAKKWKDAEALKRSSRASMNKFIGSGNYKDIMKSRVYALAASHVELSPDRAALQKNMTSAFKKAFSDLQKTLNNQSSYTSDEVKRLLFEDLVAFYLKDSIKKNLGPAYDGYLKKALNLGVWVLKFDAKKVSFNSKAEVKVELRSFQDFETQELISNHLKTKKFKKLLDEFKVGELRYSMEGLFDVNPSGDKSLYGAQAYDWVLGN